MPLADDIDAVQVDENAATESSLRYACRCGEGASCEGFSCPTSNTADVASAMEQYSKSIYIFFVMIYYRFHDSCACSASSHVCCNGEALYSSAFVSGRPLERRPNFNIGCRVSRSSESSQCFPASVSPDFAVNSRFDCYKEHPDASDGGTSECLETSGPVSYQASGEHAACRWTRCFLPPIGWSITTVAFVHLCVDAS